MVTAKTQNEYFGNNLNLNLCGELGANFMVVGNNCRVHLKNNHGSIKIIGNNNSVQVINGGGGVNCIGNNGRVTLHHPLSPEVVTFIGRNGRVLRSNNQEEMKGETIEKSNERVKVKVNNSSGVRIAETVFSSNLDLEESFFGNITKICKAARSRRATKSATNAP